MSTFQPAFGFCVEANGIFRSGDATLPLRQADIDVLEDLIGGDYTRLLVIDSMGRMVQLKVQVEGREVIVIEEGVDDIKGNSTFSSGSQVYFDWTRSNMKDWIDCVSNEADDQSPPVKIEGFASTYDAEKRQWCFNYQFDQADVTWEACGYKYAYDKGVLTKTALPANAVPTDGEYKNASIVVKNNKIVEVKSGCPTIYDVDCANCGDLESEA